MEFVAVKTDETKEIISRGYNVDKVIKEAEESGDKFILTYETPENQTFIF